MRLPHNAKEKTDPELFADFLVAYAQDTEGNVAKVARAVGLPKEAAKSIVKRLDGVYQPVVEEARRISTDGLISKIEEVLPMLLDGVTQDKVKNATLRDIAVAFGVMVEKRQLLKGEPTQILTYEERNNLNDLLPAIVNEAKRRQMTIDAEYHEVTDVRVVQPEKMPIEGLSKTAALQARRENRAKNR